MFRAGSRRALVRRAVATAAAIIGVAIVSAAARADDNPCDAVPPVPLLRGAQFSNHTVELRKDQWMVEKAVLQKISITIEHGGCVDAVGEQIAFEFPREITTLAQALQALNDFVDANAVAFRHTSLLNKSVSAMLHDPAIKTLSPPYKLGARLCYGGRDEQALVVQPAGSDTACDNEIAISVRSLGKKKSRLRFDWATTL